MARRPVFVPDSSGCPYVKEVQVEFIWHPGFARSQSQKSIASLHEAAKKMGVLPILETSGKSESPLGASLSAFNLKLKAPNGEEISVERAYQGSKVFEKGGPYHDLYLVSSRKAKTDERLRNSGNVIAFDYFGKEFPTEPKTAFYDWLYMSALSQKSPRVLKELQPYRAFSDIVFNPKTSINCQARAAAIFVSLSQLVPSTKELLEDWGSYERIVKGDELVSPTEKPASQLSLPIVADCNQHEPGRAKRDSNRGRKT